MYTYSHEDSAIEMYAKDHNNANGYRCYQGIKFKSALNKIVLTSLLSKVLLVLTLLDENSPSTTKISF